MNILTRQIFPRTNFTVSFIIHLYLIVGILSFDLALKIHDRLIVIIKILNMVNINVTDVVLTLVQLFLDLLVLFLFFLLRLEVFVDELRWSYLIVNVELAD